MDQESKNQTLPEFVDTNLQNTKNASESQPIRAKRLGVREE